MGEPRFWVAISSAPGDELLLTEAAVAGAASGLAPALPPESAPVVPQSYQTLVTGGERGSVEAPGPWQRFQTATGLGAAMGRAAVAIGIVGSVLVLGWFAGRTTVTVYNGLARSIVATVDGHSVALPPHAHTSVAVATHGSVHVTAKASDDEPIEEFDAPVRDGDTQLVYTVAAASPLRQWTATYGNVTQTPPRLVTPNRWQAVSADDLFTAPPNRIQTNGGGGTRSVIDTGDEDAPEYFVDQIEDKRASAAMMLAHVRFDAPDSPYLLDWLGVATSVPGFDAAFAQRRAHFPTDIVAMRAEQDLAKGPAHDAVCARQQALADAAPTQEDLAYLVTRCMPAGSARDRKFVEGHRRWPNSPWFANAAASVDGEQANYAAALADYQTAMDKSPALRSAIALQALRLQRLIDPASAKQHQVEFARVSPSVRNMLLLEPGAPMPTGPYRSLVLLSDGQLDEAVFAAANSPVAAHVIRLAAGSQGASTQLRARAAMLPAGEGIDEQTVWLALADGADAREPTIAAVLGNIERGYDTPGAVEHMQHFLALLRGGDSVAADRMLDGIPFQLRAEAYVAGVHLLGDRAPMTWKNYARRILFAGERPFMG